MDLISDDRKLYFVKMTTEFLGSESETLSERISSEQSLDKFLNDTSCCLFWVSSSNKSYKCSNQVPISSNHESDHQLVFLKLKPEIITKENIKAVVFMLTLIGSPISTFYHTLKQLYVPVLLSNDVGKEPQLQNSVRQLESRLRFALYQSSTVEDDHAITSLNEEIRYWQSVADSSKRRQDREKALAFLDILKSSENDFSNLDGTSNADLDEVIESCSSMLDELWRLDSHSYPQSRMENLMEVIGNTIALHIQKKMESLNVWTEEYNALRDILCTGIAACEKWNKSSDQLCTVYWSPSSERSWSGDPPVHELCTNLAVRLNQIKDIRSVFRQLTRLLSSSEQKELGTGTSFSYFKGLNPAVCSPYTEHLWQAAVKQFEKSLASMEQRVATKLKTQLRHLNANTLQLLQELKRYQELIKRPNIASHLVAERENLLGLLKEYVQSVNVNEEENRSLLDMSPVVRNIYWARQLKSKMDDVKEANEELLHDLKGSSGLKDSCDSIMKQITNFENEQFDLWVREINTGVKNNELTLSGDSKVLQLKTGRMVEVNYNPRLGRLVREVQQLSVIGLKIPQKIKEVSDRAIKFVNQAKALEQIANFHNTIGDRMIPSQKPMLLPAAQELDSLVTAQQGVTWSDTAAVDKYILRLQDAVERLSRENNKLAFYHTQIRDKVVSLLDADIIRQQNAWKQGLRDIRDVISQVEALKFPNMKSWKLHWDYQLYKALERQYQLSLCNLHSHFPEIKVDLVYRQQKLQFQPPIEEIRMKYYGQVKRFLSIPSSFRGVSDNTGPLFATIIPRNAFRFGEVFSEAEDLFERLEKVKEGWYRWVSLGELNLEELAEEKLKDADDWDWNFRASKNLGQEIAKLPCNDEKIGCITVSVMPVRAEMELHNRRYWDALVTSLQSSILREVSDLEKYTTDAMQILNTQPRTLSEVGEAHAKHAQVMAASNEMLKSLESTIKKNKTLASWTKEKMEQVNKMVATWDNFQSNIQNYESIIGRQVEGMKASLRGDTENMISEIEKFSLRWEQQRPKDTDIQDATLEMLRKSISLIKEKMGEWSQLKSTKEQLLTDFDQFGMEKPDTTLFDKIEEDLKNCEAIWSFYDEFHSELSKLSDEEWILFRGKTYRLDEFLGNWQKKVEDKETTPMTVRMLQEIGTYKAVVPMLKYVRGEMFSEKHWLEMFSLLEMTNKSPEALTLGDFLTAKDNIVQSEQKLQELNTRAASEISIRQALGELDAWEVQARFTLIPHSDSKSHSLMLIKDFSDVLNKIGDNQCLLQSISNSPNYKSFADRTAIWENKLTNLDEYVRNLNIVQRKWVYLEPIFGNGTFAMEQGRFERVDQDFRYIMAEVSKDNHVVALGRIINLRQTLNVLIDQLTRCQNSLNQYLQEKRSSFPRFYFLGDDDLLELLGQATKEKVIQTHLKKLFAGINSVLMSDGYIKTVKSLHGETVDLSSPVKITGNIEEWLSNLNVEMKKTLKSLLIKCMTESETGGGSDPLKYPSQILCLGESISFTSRCEEHITKRKLQDFHKLLKNKLDMYTGTALEWNDEDDVLELKLKALLLDAIHHINIVESLIENHVTSVKDWEWQKQLRFYMGPQKTAVVRMVDAELEYTYEYQGNAPKLVRTPLTENCFLTLTQAIRMGLGGNPYGPAGTGKTESVKALGGLLGRQVLVFNCDEGIDVKSMARIFVGLVKCGAWGCFDEFNRLEEATLSAVSMLIQPIQASLRGAKKTVKILDQEVTMDLNCGLFVTLNPAGREYGGRQKLPDNLKQLFRPVVMSVPDNEIIAQVSLYCEGFKEAKTIGRKLVEIFNLCKHLLSKQQHYDWGLRALKTVLGSCGSLFKKKKKQKEDNEQSEMELAVEAVRFNTLSKLTFGDCVLFDHLVKDVFVDVKFVSSEFQKLTDALRSSYDELGLEVNEQQVKKCIELYEQMQQRMGVTLVGPSGAGKTTIFKLLKHGLNKLGRTVKQHTMNPKSMPRTQLLGQIDLDTRQWNEGVLTNSALKLHSESSDVYSWLVCDGDVDPEWVEALNSVLDDNRLLTLPSGWRIQFSPNVNFLFETCDLSHASPATVSRMGIIFLSDEAVDVTVVVKSWLNAQEDDVRRFLEPYISDYFYKCVEWIRRKGDIVVPYSLVGLVNSGLSHLTDVKSKPHFVIALIYGLGANLTIDSRELFAKYVFETVGEFVPDSSRILDCFYNKQRERIDILSMDVSDYETGQQFSLVSTASARTSMFVLDPWLNSYQPILVIGPEGCGKSLLLKHCLSKLPATEIATVHCSALISPQHVLQKLRQVCMVTSSPTGRVFRPKNSQKLVLYLKNLELAAPDSWGTNMLIAWLQQVLSYNGFYDTDLEWTNLERIQIIGTLNEGGHTPAMRLTSVTRIYNLSPPDVGDLKTIHSIYLKSIIEQNFSRHKAWTVQSRISSLVGTLITVYQQVKMNFTQMMQKHYSFSPRDLTRWCSGIRRYSIDSGDPIRSLLGVVVYEGMRLLHDRLVTPEERSKLRDIFQSVMDNEWNQNDLVDVMEQVYYVTEGNQKILTRLEGKDWTQVINKGIMMSLGTESEFLIIDELLRLTSSIDRCLSASKGSLLLAGRPGFGRKTALRIVSALQSTRQITLNISQDYDIKNFKIDLKGALQAAGIEGESVYLVLEGHQIINNVFMDMINSLLCSGEIPGLYNTDELESTISPLRDLSAQDGFSGSTASYFAERVLKNLHVVLVLDYEESYFVSLCENNPGIYTKCEVVWLPGWSSATMKVIPRMLLTQLKEKNPLSTDEQFEKLAPTLADIHKGVNDKSVTPRRYLTFVNTCIRLYSTKKEANIERTKGLQAGVSKLTEARSVVDSLKREAAKQEEKLAEKQAKAASALDLIGDTMKNANIHKGKMEKLKEQTESESKVLLERKKAIDKELAEVEPLIAEARQAVGNIKNESLSEIRSLRAPPDVIRDILEGVLRLMGIQDTSWNSMKTFLAKRGVKEEIRTFDAHKISEDSREAVDLLMQERRDSFDPKVAKRASVAAAPLAAWVKANIKYAKVVEKIRPLEKEQMSLQKNLKTTEDQVGKLSTGLGEVDKRVAELKEQLNTYTREAAIIEIHLAKAQETMSSAQELVSKLEDEYNRWRSQLTELSEDLKQLPRNAILASAFISYLASSSENSRQKMLTEWEKIFGNGKFSIVDFLSTERDKLKWVSEGLSSDQLSVENGVIILESWLRPCLVDPNGTATTWLSNHFVDKNVEVVSQHNPRFQTTLELAVRFGKTLVVEDVDEVHPVLYPILRKDIISQGPRQVVHVGDKAVDYHKDFNLFLVTRSTAANIPPDATAVSFMTTRQGLAGQLLACAIQQERPDLESRRSEILKQQEEMKSKLYDLQEILLKELASAQGDILQNKDLLNSLNETKAKSEEISKALEESKNLELQLDKECESYKPISEFGSNLYFTIIALSELCSMYQYSVQAFKKLFQKSLKIVTIETENTFENQRKNLIKVIYQYVSRSLFKADRLSFALHLVKHAFPEKIPSEEWKVLTGEAVSDLKTDPRTTDNLPNWAEEDRGFDVNVLKQALPNLYSTLDVTGNDAWSAFAKSGHCEKDIPKNVAAKINHFQTLLVVQAFRPDRLHSVMTQFALKALSLDTLSPAAIRLSQVAEESVSSEPILLIVSPGADPSEELRTLSKTSLGFDIHEIALGQGQTTMAMELLKSCAENGNWLCLKNLHLMTGWLGDLEKEFRGLKLHTNFRLWLTTEPHGNFSIVLANSCLKITYEAPPGIKKNLQRTYGSWTSDMCRRKGTLFGRTLFAAAWFHAVVQERRTYIPQGWSKYYELTDSDLFAATDLISRMFAQEAGAINWDFIHGLLLNAIYGGRIDNEFDIRVLGAYLREFFSDSVLSKGRSFGPGLALPSTESYSEYLELIHRLSDFDQPSYFGLPENIERTWQKITSSQVIDQLKVLDQPSKSQKLDINSWQQNLSPVLNLWKKLNQGAGLIEIKASETRSQTRSDDPVLEFIVKDFLFGVKVIQFVHKTLAGISKVIRGVTLPSGETIKIAETLLQHQTPIEWQNYWEGPDNPLKYLRMLVNRGISMQKLTQKPSSETVLTEQLDLSYFFLPETFLKAVKQLTARKTKVPLDELEISCDWKGTLHGAKITFRARNLQLEGAGFDGRNFIHATVESPSVISAPTVTIGFVRKESFELDQGSNKVVFPVYRSSERSKLIMTLPVPCHEAADEWFKTGAAFFLKD